MKRILIIGATSAIASETALLWGKQGHALFLVARNAQKLDAVVGHLQTHGCQHLHQKVMDLNAPELHLALIEEAATAMGGLDMLLIAHGSLSPQAACEQDAQLTLAEMHVNFMGPVSLLTHAANYFEARGQGTIGVITSVAGDRGRMSNYVYGSAKGGLSRFLQGMRHRLAATGVRVVDIKPGFVDTPMTAHIERKGLLFATPERVAKGIVKAMARGQHVVYLPGFWRLILTVVRLTPHFIFHKTKF